MARGITKDTFSAFNENKLSLSGNRPCPLTETVLYPNDEGHWRFSKSVRVSDGMLYEPVNQKSIYQSYFVYPENSFRMELLQRKTQCFNDVIGNQKFDFIDQVKTVVIKELIEDIDKLEKCVPKMQFLVLSDNVRKNIWSMISTLKLEFEYYMDEKHPHTTASVSFLNSKKQLQELLDAILEFLNTAGTGTECSTTNDILGILQLCKQTIMALKSFQIDMENIEMAIPQIFTKVASLDCLKKMNDIKDKVESNSKPLVSINLRAQRKTENNVQDGLLDKKAVGQKIASRHECRLIMNSHHYRFFSRKRRKPSVTSCVFLLTALFILEVAISSASSDRNLVEITAVVVQENGELHLKLECVSLYQPFACSVEILANGKTVDEIRYVDENCYHKKGLCREEICICFNCTNFTWFSKLSSIPTNTTYSCRMSFDEDTTHNYKYYESSLIYNGTDFTILSNTGFKLPTDEQVTNTTKNNDTTEIISHTENHTLVYSLVGSAIIVVVLVIGGFVLYRQINKNKGIKGSLGTKNETTSSLSEGSDEHLLPSSKQNIEP